MAFNLSKADQSASSNSKGKFNLSKTEVSGGGDSERNSDSNDPKKSKLGLILLILAIGVGAWLFFSKNSTKNDLVEKSDTLVNTDTKNANIPNSDDSSTVGDNSSQEQKTPDIKASSTSAESDKDNSGNSASATSTKATSSSRVNEPKAATAATSTKASSSSRVNEPKAATAATSTKASRNRNTSVVNFKNGSAELVDINDLKISLILDKLKSNSNLEITVEGYASSEGDLEFNINLSQKRADKYASYLVSQGVPKSNIKSIGKGIDNPIASNDTEEGRAQNRRVEVIIK